MTQSLAMNYPAIAAAVYQACNHFDPYLPPLSEDLARAWGRLFERHNLSVEDLLAAVDRVYDEHGHGYRPLPKDIVDAARKLRQERDAHHGPSAEYQALCDSKAAPDEAPEVTAERRQRIQNFTTDRSRFTKLPGTATAEAESRLQQLARAQRAALPPAPLPPEPGDA